MPVYRFCNYSVSFLYLSVCGTRPTAKWRSKREGRPWQQPGVRLQCINATLESNSRATFASQTAPIVTSGSQTVFSAPRPRNRSSVQYSGILVKSVVHQRSITSHARHQRHSLRPPTPDPNRSPPTNPASFGSPTLNTITVAQLPTTTTIPVSSGPAVSRDPNTPKASKPQPAALHVSKPNCGLPLRATYHAHPPPASNRNEGSQQGKPKKTTKCPPTTNKSTSPP